MGRPRHEDGGGDSRPPLHPPSTRRLDAVQLTPHQQHRSVLNAFRAKPLLDLTE